MRWTVITLVVIPSPYFGWHCLDARLWKAVIGGDTINGSIVLHQKPLQSAQILTERVPASDRRGFR